MSNCEVLCIGEAMVMVTPIAGGRLDAKSHYILRAGGAESNVATNLAALGHAVAWAGYVGDDPLGTIICSELEAAAVDMSFVRRITDSLTGIYFKDPHEEGTSVFYYRTGSAASTMGSECFDEWRDANPQALHLSGITAAISESCRDLLQGLIVERVLGDALVSFDVNFRPSLWTERDAPVELLELAQASDIVFVGLDEAGALWGASSAEEVREILNLPAVVVVKDGGIEAVSFAPEGVTRAPAKQVDIVDQVGAGDAFAAGWLSGMLRGSDPTSRLQLGHLVASQVLTSTTDSPELSLKDAISASIRSDMSERDSTKNSRKAIRTK